MKKILFSTSISLLVITGITAIYGGLRLMIDPTGEGIGFSLSRLKFLPLKNYFLPGLLLLTVIGIGSMGIAVMVFRKNRHGPLLLMLQGLLLVGWIIVQALTVPSSFLQYLFGTIGVVFVISGLTLSRRNLQPGI